jgi:hypothetical protein
LETRRSKKEHDYRLNKGLKKRRIYIFIGLITWIVIGLVIAPFIGAVWGFKIINN